MIFGECPYDDCSEVMLNSICENPPMFQRLICDNCGRVIWLYHSRLDPVAYTEDGFTEKYEVDEKTKSIKERTPE